MATSIPSTEKPSLEDLLRDIPPEKLDLPCRDDHLNKLALSLTDWKSVAPFLGLTEAEEEEIKSDYPNTKAQRVAMLRKWKVKVGRRAKYRKLVSVFYDLERTDLVEKACELLLTVSSSSSSDEDNIAAAVGSEIGTMVTQSGSTGTLGSTGKYIRTAHEMKADMPSHATLPKQTKVEKTQKIGTFMRFYEKLIGKRKSVLDLYAKYLRGRYKTERPTFFTLQWPPPPTRKVFNLAMIGHETIQRGPIDEELVRLTLRGSVDDIMKIKSSISLKNLFKLDKEDRKIILIEGAPGAGKSTLAWHIVQRWESGELFEEFKVVVFVQLRDPAIQSATSLADILPVESESMSIEIMSELQSCEGKNVLFVLDGWDEYGAGLGIQSLFRQLICNPGAVNLHFSSLIITSRPIASGALQQYASSRVEIVGFTSGEMKKYFRESICDTVMEQKFQDHLRERPLLEVSCYLPLNAAIVVHLFLALNHTLPHTLHEVFLKLVLCCIIRHLTKQAGEEKEIPDISSLDDLPPDVLEQFNSISIMAYHGVMKNKATFSAADLRSFNLPTQLSTLSLIQGMQSFMAFKKSVSYNFLHMSVQELLGAFYISKLPATEQIQVFNDLLDQPRLAAVFRFYAAFTKLQTEGVRDIVAKIVQKRQKPLLVNLLHGLYEAQDLSLCQFVASYLNGKLDLEKNTLSPMDFLVVGYFLSCASLTTSTELQVNLSWCSHGDRISSLARELSKCSSTTNAQTTTEGGVPGCFAMDLSHNNMGKDGAEAIGDALIVNRFFRELDLHDNPISVGVMHIAESLKRNHSLLEINLAKCGISKSGGKAIGSALMTNRSLQVLNLQNNPIATGVVHIAAPLNLSLVEINLGNCGISAQGGKAIGDALMVNKSLQVLNLQNNPIASGVVHIAHSLKFNNSLLEINLGDCCLIAIAGKYIGDALMVNGSLQVLNLCDNPISAGIVHIAESLAHNCSLLEINLRNCGIVEEEFRAICDALSVNRKSLCVLDTTEEDKQRRICKVTGDAIEVDISLEALDSHHKPICTDVAEFDAVVVNTSLETLDSHHRTLSAGVAESLKHNHPLQEVTLGKCGIEEEGSKAISDALMVNSSLQVLDLHGNPISAGVVHIAESLKHNHSLLEINLVRCGITEDGGKAIGSALMENTSLQSLNLLGNPIAAGVVHIAASLKHNHSLLDINLSWCGITEEGVKAIGSALMENTSLQMLDLHGNPTSAGMVHTAESLKHNYSLLKINLGNCGMADKELQAIGDALMVNTSLRLLDIHDNPIAADVVHIAESLKHNHSLLEINLVRCGIHEEESSTISDALIVNRSLQVLGLHGNPISAGVIHIAESLKHNHSLLKIDLSWCGMTEKGSRAIGDALIVNRALQVLDIHGNPIAAGVVHIAESLKLNHSLLEINLGNCGLTGKEAESLATSLKENASLQTLYLDENNLSDGGTARIADGLRYNSCLKTLDISDRGLTDSGMKSIGSALEVNSSLHMLNIRWNHAVTGVGLMALGRSLKENTGLKTLSLYGWLCDISYNDWKQFRMCLRENNHLTKLFLSSSTREVVRQNLTILNNIRRKNNLPPLILPPSMPPK